AAWGGLPPLEMWRDWTRAGHRAFEALARLRVPLIAALTGHAFGGGLELAAVADIRVAESGIKLGLPESSLGMAPGWSGTQRLVRRFGASVVRRMALTGAMFPAEDGLTLGLVDEVVPKGEGLSRADALATDIAKRGPLAVQMVKAMINAAEGEDRDAPIEGLAGALTAYTEDLAKGVAAFNTFMDGTPELPFGGYRQSGIGRELGRTAVKDYTEEKTFHVHTGPRTSWWLPRGA